MPDRPKLSDLEILKNLEDEIGMKFRKLRRNSFTTHCYVLDKRLDVVGMSIPHFDGKKLPVNLLKLKKIRRLYLNNLKMNVFPIELRELPNLEYVEFWNSKISHLPPEALEIGLPIKLRVQATRGILLEGAKLTTPPIEIVAQGNLAIEQYYKSIEQEGEQANLNELKVVLVGDGGAGKTSLVRQIFGDEFNKFESQTHGIEVRKYSFQSRFRPIKVNFWDFGGQEIMHATHQFFLSHRSLYILVLDGRRDEKTEYWLKNIESFGGNSPILIVMNKIDQNPSFELNQRFLKEKYIGIKGFYRISCASKDGVETFIQKLKSAIVNVDLLRMTWPKSWFDVKNELEHLNQEYISYDAFRKICVDRKINESARQEVLLEFLHDLGVVLHFKDFELLDTQVLDPQWVTSGVYSIINSHVLAKRHGVLRISELSNILPMSSGQGTKFFLSTGETSVYH
ncbi:MAG: GTP-binding protein [Rhodospirillales bacterium]|nr:GTP-binding protein [Rhodospirillales bacterium]